MTLIRHDAQIMKPRFQFSNVVIVDKNLVGVVVKTWHSLSGEHKGYNYDVYVRTDNLITNYHENDMKHFVYDKELTDEQLEYYDEE